MRVVHGLKSWKVRASFLLGVLGVFVVYGFSGVSGEESHRSSLAASSLEISADGSVIVSSDRSNRVALWDGDSLKLREIKSGYPANTCDFEISPDGKVFGSSDRGFTLWDVATGKLRFTSQDQSGSVYDISFSPDGKLFANTSFDGSVKLWDIDSGRLRMTLKGHKGYVTSAKFSPDGRKLASSGSDGAIKIWDVSSGKVQETIMLWPDSSNYVCFSDDGDTLFVANSGTLALDLRTGKKKFELKTPGYWTEFQDYSAKTSTLVTSAWKLGTEEVIVSLWDSHTGALKRTLDGIVGVTCAHFSPDGSLLMICSVKESFLASDGNWGSTIRLWDVAEGKMVASKEFPKFDLQGAVFTPDSSTIIYDEDGLKKWRVR
jgi:WD40 repeat protein